jgi:hypothetical protein
MPNNNSIPREWRTWIAENKMLKVKDERIIDILKRNGFHDSIAQKQIRSASKSPAYEAGQLIAQRYLKLESLLEVYRNLYNLSNVEIERRSCISRSEFLHEYYALNRPVLLTELMKDWRALSLWTPAYLKEKCGEMIVEITSGRSSDPKYELNLNSHKTKILFKEYVDMVMTGGASNDYYLVANNFFLKEEGAKGLYNDIAQFPEYLDTSESTENGSLWFGPAGTITPLHHDVMNILVAQVYGRKLFSLIPSNHAHLLYNEKGVFSEVDLDQPDYGHYPRFKEVRPIEVMLSPGEVLFVPVGWWHHVRALDISITVSFINFVFPNTYKWSNPQIYR